MVGQLQVPGDSTGSFPPTLNAQRLNKIDAGLDLATQHNASLRH